MTVVYNETRYKVLRVMQNLKYPAQGYINIHGDAKRIIGTGDLHACAGAFLRISQIQMLPRHDD